MQEAIKTFSYTAQRGSYLNIVGVFIFLLIVEGGAIELPIALFVSILWLKLAMLAVTIGLYLYIIMLLLFPLWTKHHLTATHFHLRYGLSLNVSIPRSAISNVQAIRKSSSRIQPISARYEAHSQRIVACFSDQGMVMLTLNQPLALRLGLQTRTTTHILLNVDQRDGLLNALTAAQTSIADVPTTGRTTSMSEPTHTDNLTSTHMNNSFSSLISPTGHAVDTSAVAIRIEGLTRRFVNFTAVATLYMTIRRGEIYGFLGSNGAGKSTTIKMLVGLLQPSTGRVWIADHDAWTEPLVVKKLLGYVADHALLYERLTGREFLDFLAQLRGLPKAVADERITSLLDMLELTEHADRLCGAYSFGMKRKLSLAGALLHQPAILILDEPLNGLDPRSARRIKDLFLALAAQGTTIVLSTHDLATAETVCHRVGIFHKGHLLTEGSAAELRQLAAAPDLETVFLNLTSEQEQPEEELV